HPPPANVRASVESLRSWRGDFYSAKPFVAAAPPGVPPPPSDRRAFSMRLGNHIYPHMKLKLEPAPTGGKYLFRADTHDRHICPPPEHPEYAPFMKLRVKNQEIGDAIEQAWAAAGILTFKTYLEHDLAARRLRAADPERI
ncbi:MAG TPA: hypothetical protein VH518_10180, partial [Tepidisphaeraceae bacterium]